MEEGDDAVDNVLRELVPPVEDVVDSETSTTIQHKKPPAEALKKGAVDEDSKDQKALLIAFILMVFVGLGNKIFQVLQMVPMYNYPLFLNMLSTFIYLPASFAYIWPMLKWGSLITKEATEVPKYKFAVMGLLDSLAGILQSLAVNFIQNGSLVILLMQAAIPVSLVISYFLMNKRYKNFQYVGAVLVMVGIIIVMIPTFVHPDSKNGNNVILWSALMVASCIPMCLSSVYKEIALGDTEIDAVYMNGWIAVYQMLASFPLLIPGAYASNLTVQQLPRNMYWGLLCYAAVDSVKDCTGPDSKHLTCPQPEYSQDDDCHWSPVYVSIYLFFNIGYNVLILLILKYGSANILWLAMTLMVPLGNVAFMLPFMPDHHSFEGYDIGGLIIIMLGLIVYRFWGSVSKRLDRWRLGGLTDATKPMLEPATPGSPFLQSKSADDTVSTPGRGGVHVMHKHKEERQSRNARKPGGLSTRAKSTRNASLTPTGYQSRRADDDGEEEPMEDV